MKDRRLPFGARPSPTHFHRLSQGIKRMMRRRGYNKIVAYHDDFLVIADTESECMKMWKELIALMIELGFDINYAKAEAPSKTMTFLGIELNSSSMEISLPQAKLISIRNVLKQYVGKSRASKRQLQSLAGKLNHAAKVVRGGRTFLRRILNCIGKLKDGHHKCRLNGAVMKDILWWYDFMSYFNGTAMCIKSEDAVTVATDACLEGGGAFYMGDFYYVNWKQDFPELDPLPINYKEAAMAALCIKRWAPLWSNKRVYLYSDNICAVSIINKCACKNEQIMSLLRHNFWVAANSNIHVTVLYLPGTRNTVADTISRLHESVGHIQHLESIINDWFLCHWKLRNVFDYVSMMNHMSMKSLLALQDLPSWRALKWPWMCQFAST